MKEFDSRNYNRADVASRYEQERFAGPVGRWVDGRERGLILEALHGCHASAGDAILDLACGTGRVASTLSGAGFKVTGLDYSLEMLRQLGRKQSAQGVAVVRADAGNLPFAAKSFDFAVSMRFFGHISPEARIGILAELNRVTRKSICVAYYRKHTCHTLVRYARYAAKGTFYGYLTTYRDIKREAAAAGLALVDTLPTLRFVHQGVVAVLRRSQ